MTDSAQLLPRAADTTGMTRRQLRRLLERLDRSPLPMTDAARLELEAELIDRIAEVERRERPPISGIVAIVST